MPEPIDHTTETRAEAERQLDAKDEYAEAHGYPTFQDEPSAFLVGFIAGAEWQAAQQTETRITDEMVLAALNAWDPRFATDNLDDYAAEHIDDMRAALVAALEGGVAPAESGMLSSEHTDKPDTESEGNTNG